MIPGKPDPNSRNTTSPTIATNDRAAKSREALRKLTTQAGVIGRRLWSELCATAAATVSMAWRLVQHGIAVARMPLLARTLRRAQTDVGEKMYRDGVGDQSTRESTRELDTRIEQAKVAKQSASKLVAERRTLINRLGEAALGDDSVQGPERDAALSCQRELEQQRQQATTTRAALKPHDRIEVRRLAVGFTVCLTLLVAMGLLARGHRPRVEVVADAPRAKVQRTSHTAEGESPANSRNRSEAPAPATGPICNGRPVEAWIKAVKEGNASERHEAALVLGTAEPNAKVVAALAAALEDPDESVRGTAALSLGKIGEAGVPPLIRALRIGDTASNSNLVIGLAQAGRPAIASLIEMLDSYNHAAVSSASVALGMIGRPAVPDLIVALGHDSPQVRSFALIALENVGADAEDAIPAIRERLRDSHPKMRELAAEILEKLKPH